MKHDVIVGRVIRTGPSWLDLWVDGEATGNTYLYRDVERLHAPGSGDPAVRHFRVIGRTLEVHLAGRREDDRLAVAAAIRR